MRVALDETDAPGITEASLHDKVRGIDSNA